MFALLAAVCFLLALLGVVAPFDLLTLGWLFLAISIAIAYPWPWRRTP